MLENVEMFSRGRVIVNFVAKFVAMATGIDRGKILMTPSDSPGPKIRGYVQTSRNYLLQGLSYSQFCPKNRCHGNGGWQEKI